MNIACFSAPISGSFSASETQGRTHFVLFPRKRRRQGSDRSGRFGLRRTAAEKGPLASEIPLSRAHPDRVELPAELRDLLIRIRATAKRAEMATMAPASPVRQAGSRIIARVSDF